MMGGIMRVPIFVFLALGLYAQGPDLDHERMNVWLFPPSSPGLIAERVVASSAGRVYVGTRNGLFSLEVGEYVHVEGLPGQPVLDLQRLQSGDVGVRFSSGSYSVVDQHVQPLSDLPALPPQTGSFDWAGMAVEVRPIQKAGSLKPVYDLKVTRKSDLKVLLSGKNIQLDQPTFWKAVSH